MTTMNLASEALVLRRETGSMYCRNPGPNLRLTPITDQSCRRGDMTPMKPYLFPPRQYHAQPSRNTCQRDYVGWINGCALGPLCAYIVKPPS